jgi:hypothetical protein
MRKPKTIKQLIEEMDKRYLEMYRERNNPKNPHEDWENIKERRS